MWPSLERDSCACSSMTPPRRSAGSRGVKATPVHDQPPVYRRLQELFPRRSCEDGLAADGGAEKALRDYVAPATGLPPDRKREIPVQAESCCTSYHCEYPILGQSGLTKFHVMGCHISIDIAGSHAARRRTISDYIFGSSIALVYPSSPGYRDRICTGHAQCQSIPSVKVSTSAVVQSLYF
uniref:Uncharacterized protein n=1 Tax=Timema cristinae TaxID=61476 RepID=A0A7R9D769_TIMCR|nr:unnamed protein product [Timema cristinae]